MGRRSSDIEKQEDNFLSMKGKSDVEAKARSTDWEGFLARRRDMNLNSKATLGCPWLTVRFVTDLV